MILLSTVVATERESSNMWLGSLYAGLITAVIALVAVLMLSMFENAYLFGLVFLLIGIGPVLGYQAATGKVFSDWKPIVGGILGMILAPISFIIWPLLVGALDETQSVGKLLLGSIIGTVLAIAVLLILLTLLGQNPYSIGFNWIMAVAVWGGSVGAAMIAWRQA